MCEAEVTPADRTGCSWAQNTQTLNNKWKSSQGCEYKNVLLFQISDRQERLCRSQHHLTSHEKYEDVCLHAGQELFPPSWMWSTGRPFSTTPPSGQSGECSTGNSTSTGNQTLNCKTRTQSRLFSLWGVCCFKLFRHEWSLRGSADQMYLYFYVQCSEYSTSRKLQMRAKYQHKGKTAQCLTYFL